MTEPCQLAQGVRVDPARSQAVRKPAAKKSHHAKPKPGTHPQLSVRAIERGESAWTITLNGSLETRDALERIKAAHPGKSTSAIVRRLIREEAARL